MPTRRINFDMILHSVNYRNPYDQTESYSVFPKNVQSPISSIIDDKATHEVSSWSCLS